MHFFSNLCFLRNNLVSKKGRCVPNAQKCAKGNVPNRTLIKSKGRNIFKVEGRIFMSMNFAVIGGDLRIVKLAKMLGKEGNKVNVYGSEEADDLKESKQSQVVLCESLQQATQDAKIVIAPIPLTSDGKRVRTPFSKHKISVQDLLVNSYQKTVMAGSIRQEVYALARKQKVEIIDLMESEELAVLNAIATAEGAIEVAMSHTNQTIQGSKTLILGFGRIGKVLAKKMQALSSEVTVAVRRQEDKAWLEAYGYKSTDIYGLQENLFQYDIIMNTVPHLILTTERLQYVDKECLLMDLASKPGGMDQTAVEERKLKFVWALALPGKVAPVTSAKYIKDIIYQKMKE